MEGFPFPFNNLGSSKLNFFSSIRTHDTLTQLILTAGRTIVNAT